MQSHHNIFRIAVNTAVESEVVNRNRFTRISITSDEDEDDNVLENFLDPSQLKVFLRVAKEELNITEYTAVLLLAYTGLRRGEAQALRWNDIDFTKKKLTVDETKDYFGVRSPKTKRSRRTIIISDVIITQLKIYRKWCMETFFSTGKKSIAEDFILIKSDGIPVHHEYIRLAFKKIYKATDLKRITPHGLRQTHATILLMSEDRIPVAAIAKRLGNTPQMINSVYEHVISEVEVESVETFDNAISL